MPTTARALLAILLATVLAPAAAHADEVAPSTTPGLINEALTEGRISPERATVLRAQALDGDPALPAAYRSTDPWDGTTTMLQVQEDYDELSGTQRRAVGDVIADAGEQESCGADSTGALDTRLDSAHFRIDFAAGGVGGGLTADDYRDALEVAWAKQVDEYGWAAPPTASGLGGRVHVRISPLPGGLLGYVTNVGTHASFAGDNPNTAWDDLSAEATCMVLKADLSNLGGGTTPQGLLSSTTAHELNHTLQFGYGAADSDIKPDAHMFEGGATFIEQDTQADDTALFRVPPYPHLSFGAFPDWADQYSMFYVLRGMAERFGVGTAGGQEQVMQDFWETLSRRQHGGQMGALEQAFALKGTTAGEAFHDYAITAKFLMPCGGGFPAGRCFEDAGIYRTKPRLLQPSRGGHGAADAGAPWTGEIEDDLTLNWIRLPWSASAFDVTLTNTSSGGALRATAACDAGGTLREMGALAPLTAGEDGTIEIADPAPCTTRPFLIVTNESTGTGNPDTSAKRSYTVSVDGPKRAVRMRWTTGSAGTGTITLAPAQGSPVDCTSDCTVDFDPGASITLTAAPNGTGRFLGFSGGGCSGTDPCVVTMSQAREIRAGFAPENPVDYGFYRVFPASESLDMDIDTGPLPDYGDESWTQDCVAGTPMCATHQREVGSPFTLTAREAIGAGQRQRFRGWQGPGADDCVDAERACTFEIVSNINPSRSIIAVAETDSQLTWTQTGEGSIEILTMGDPSQYCSADCTVWINETNGPGIKVTPAAGWRFVSFGEGQCERETLPSVCGVGAMGVPRAVHGTFERIPKHDLTVGLAGVGSGKVTSAPNGIDCGATCSGAFEEDEEVTLTATPSDNASVFSSWSGACSGTSPTCTVTMSEARSVTADFGPAPTYALDVTVGGTGAGRVFSWGSTDIDCGTDCAESYLSGPTVTLLAHASAGSSLAGWGGACAGSVGPVCYVYMTEARAVTVFFDLVPSEPEPEPTPTPSPSPTPEPSATPAPEPDPDSGAVPPTDEAPVIVPETPAFADPVSPVISTLPPAEPPLAEPPLAIAPKVTQPKQTMAAVIKQGVSLRLTAPVASTVTATLSVDKRVAKKLGLAVKGGRATAGAGTGTAGPRGGALRVKLGAKAGKAAKKLKSFPALLTITTTSPGTAPKVSTRQVTVGR